ncbi:DUF3618 domain-containing protein [Micromonospora sp. WMMD812]|uniref:DUF3618 domain-containing protein n=1 Tax=Micromonospora sp. WMMD812 TaxID=3015152 RepID=UPI00248B5ED7|nr:DUF3618 domain-containing protein [Micromonospora sp. WMMD812]WBB66130.1 DUF3618 domain-containing protein [Micromonospora sp. WMMD812]
MSTDPDRIRQEIEHTRRDLSDNVDALADRVNPRRMAGDRVDQARGTLNRVKEKVMGTQMDGHGAGQRMSNAAGSVRDETRSLGQQSREQAQGNPLAAGVIAFGAGLLASALIPPSRQERQWAGQAKGMAGQQFSQHSGELREQASQMGHQLRDNMREPARQAARSVGSTALHGASAVREEGRSATQQVRGQAQEAAGEFRR